MNVLQRCLRRPRTVFLRKASFQIHLWVGIATGIYIVLLSVTGSALVFRREMDRAIRPQGPPLETDRPVMSKEALADIARRDYPGATVERVGDPQRRTALIRIILRQDGQEIERDYNGYTGEDLGDPWPWKAQMLLRLAELHDDLLMLEDRRGRWWNGVGSIFVTLLCLTGFVIWWRGLKVWSRGLAFKWRSTWPRFNFDVHSSLGFWFFAILLIWAVSGIYLSFPDPFIWSVDTIWGPTDEILSARPGDRILEWLVRLHFGRWRSHTLKAIWVIMGLIPAVMFVTGFAMWWHRVMRKRVSHPTAQACAAGTPVPAAEPRPAVLALQQEPQQVE